MVNSVLVQIRYSAILLLLSLGGCDWYWSEYEESYLYYSPVYAEEQVAHAISVSPPMAIEKPDKIFTYLDFLIVNIKNQGFHVIDNSNPSNPVNLYFINVPGNKDVAIKDGMIFVDNYDDVVAFVIDENQEVVVKQRLEAAISNIPPYGQANFECIDSSKGVVISWTESYVSEEDELPECSTE